MQSASTACPCGSQQPYQHCCQPLHQGEQHADTAEQLMRSRFSAFAKQDVDYLIHTLHPAQHADSDRQQITTLLSLCQWKALVILDAQATEVEFVAFYQENDSTQWQQLHERSTFEQIDGQWYYVGGTILPAKKWGRNDPCWCGSGTKLKKCHG